MAVLIRSWDLPCCWYWVPPLGPDKPKLSPSTLSQVQVPALHYIFDLALQENNVLKPENPRNYIDQLQVTASGSGTGF